MPLRLDRLEAVHGLPPGLLSAVREVESGGDQRAVSPKGARGAFQLMPATAQQYDVDPFDPEQSAMAAARMFGELSEKYGGDVRKMLAGYNWGQGNVDRKGLDAMPTETRNYILRVSERLPGASVTPEELGAALYGRREEAPSATVTARDLGAALYGTADVGPVAPSAPTPRASTVNTPSPKDVASIPVGSIKVTPDMAEDDIIRSFGYDPDLVKSSAYYRPDFFKNSLTDPKGFTASVMRGQLGAAVRGLRDPIDAGSQMLVRGLRGLGLRGDADVAFTDLVGKVAESDYQQNWQRGKRIDPETGESGIEWSRIVGNMLVPLPGGTLKAVGLVGKAALAATRGAIGALSQPVVNADSEAEFAAQKLRQGVIGAIAGPVAEAIGEKVVAPVVGKVGNFIAGRMKPNVAIVEDLGRKYGVDLTVGDISNNPLAKKTEVALESFPGVGMVSRRQAQQGQVAEAATGVAGKARQAMLDTAWDDLASVQRAAQGTGPKAKAAQALLDEVANAGEDWATITQVSGNLKAFRTKLKADALYDDVEKLAEPLGNVPATRTLDAIDRAIGEASQSKIPDKQSIKFLQELRDSLTGTPPRVTEEVSPVLDAAGRPLTHAVTLPGEPPVNTFSILRQARGDLGAILRDAKTGDAAISGTRATAWLGRVKDALGEDLDEFAQAQNPALRTAWKKADRFYREQYTSYKDKQLASALTQAYPDEVYGKFVKRGAYGDRAEFFFNALDAKGKAAVRYGLINDALQAAQNETARGGIAVSPRKFASFLEKYRGARSVFFQGEEKWKLDGFMKLMNHVERAGQYAENPPTGNRLIPFLLATGVGGGTLAGGAAGGVGTAGGFAGLYGLAAVARPLFTSKLGKRLLLAASDLPENSPKLDALLREIEQKLIPRAAGTWAGGVEGRTEGDN